jgi:hypothetical protein
MVRKKPPNEVRTGHPHSAFPEDAPITVGQSKRHLIQVLPVASERWLPNTKAWFESLSESSQSAQYEASDWATAVCAAEALDVATRTRNASVLAHFVRLSERLGVTMIDRKKSMMDTDGPDGTDADSVAADVVKDWHQRLHRHGLAPVPDPDSPDPNPAA